MDFTHNVEVDSWLVELDELYEHKSCEAPNFIKPFHFATIVHKLRNKDLAVFNVPEKISSYAATMDLWGALGIPSPVQVNRNLKGGRYYPLDVLRDRSKIETTASALVKIITPVCNNEETIDAVHTMLRELIDNCYSHSDVADGFHGVICAQVWAGGSKAQIAIVDTGVGIRASLQQNPLLSAILERENSCEIATQYGVTGKPGKGHSGYGLAVARKLMEQNNGVLMVRSGNECFTLRNNKTAKFVTNNIWEGTLLVIEWDISRSMDISQVYKSFPLPEGMNDDDFDF